MEIATIMICLLCIIAECYIRANVWTNELAATLFDRRYTISFWTDYDQRYKLLDLIGFYLAPCCLTIFVFSWWGLLYIPLSLFVIIPRLSIPFFRLALNRHHNLFLDNVKKEKSVANKSATDKVHLELAINRVNASRWLKVHPKAAQHLALSICDGKANSKIRYAFDESLSSDNAMDGEVSLAITADTLEKARIFDKNNPMSGNYRLNLVNLYSRFDKENKTNSSTKTPKRQGESSKK